MKKRMNYKCPDSETLLAFSDGSLEQNKMVSINEHLMECDICLREVVISKRMLNAATGEMVSLTQELKERALIVARGMPKEKRYARYLSEFVLALSEKGISYVSNLILPEEAKLNISSTAIPATAFRSGEKKEGEALIIEEDIKGIKLKITLIHTRGPSVTIKVYLIKNGNFMKNKRITLYQDESLLSSKVTSREGFVEFPDISVGYYSIKVFDEEIELRFKLNPEKADERG